MSEKRIQVSFNGEEGRDLLAIAAAVRGVKESAIAGAVTAQWLREHRVELERAVRYLADKRSIPFGEMWLKILKGDYEPMTEEELAAIEEMRL